jgi:hypothetical protein
VEASPRLFERPAYGQRAVRGREFAGATEIALGPGTPGAAQGRESVEPVPAPLAAAA